MTPAGATAMASRKQRIPRDIVRAPDVRIERGEVELEERTVDDDRGKVVGLARGDVVRSWLYRYRARGEIQTDRQYKAGRLLEVQIEAAEVSIRSLLNPERLAGAGEGPSIKRLGERRAEATLWLRQARYAVGPTLWPILVHVVGNGRPASEWAESAGKPHRHGIAALCLALDALAAFCRLDSHCQ